MTSGPQWPSRDVADRVIFMDQGLMVGAGPPSQVIDAPAFERRQSFLSRFRASH
jgi:polar amino acid transport system ATP-binding protein